MNLSAYEASVIEARVLEALVEDDQLDERSLGKLPVEVVELFGMLDGPDAKLYYQAAHKGFGNLSAHDQKSLRSALAKSVKDMDLNPGDQEKTVDYAIKSITRRVVASGTSHYIGAREPMAASLDSACANLDEVVRRGETVKSGKDFGSFSTFTVGDDEGTAFKARTADGKVVPIIIRGDRSYRDSAEVIIPGGKRVTLSGDQALKLKHVIGQYDMADVPALVNAVRYDRKLPEHTELDETTSGHPSWTLMKKAHGWQVVHKATGLPLGFYMHKKSDAARLTKMLPVIPDAPEQSDIKRVAAFMRDLDLINDEEYPGAMAFKSEDVELGKRGSFALSEDAALHEVSPPGFEGTVLALKQKHPEIENPWRLAWSLKKRGAKSHYRVKDGKPVHKKEETMREASGCQDDCDCEPCMKSRAKKAKSEGLSGALSSAMGESKAGQWFVIIDKKTGKAVGNDIFVGSKKADDALDKMGGESKTGYQVMDAMWHNPSRAKLKAMGWIGEGRESAVSVDAHADPSDAGYEPAYALPPNKSDETAVNVNAVVASIIDDVFRDNKPAKPETVEPMGVGRALSPTKNMAEGGRVEEASPTGKVQKAIVD